MTMTEKTLTTTTTKVPGTTKEIRRDISTEIYRRIKFYLKNHLQIDFQIAYVLVHVVIILTLVRENHLIARFRIYKKTVENTVGLAQVCKRYDSCSFYYLK